MSEAEVEALATGVVARRLRNRVRRFLGDIGAPAKLQRQSGYLAAVAKGRRRRVVNEFVEPESRQSPPAHVLLSFPCRCLDEIDATLAQGCRVDRHLP